MPFIQKLFSTYHDYANQEVRIGEKNRIWYDSITNTFRLSDGVTPGGIPIGGGGGGGLAFNTKLVTTATYTAVPGDYYIGVSRNGPVTIYLPSSSNGDIVIVKDESGACSSNPITLVGVVDNDLGGAVLETDNGTLQLIYREGWRII
jgi:hypothetical protein